VPYRSPHAPLDIPRASLADFVLEKAAQRTTLIAVSSRCGGEQVRAAVRLCFA